MLGFNTPSDRAPSDRGLGWQTAGAWFPRNADQGVMAASRGSQRMTAAISAPMPVPPRNVGLAAISGVSLDIAAGTILEEAATRMSRDMFIVLAMLGIPPAKAREMANNLTAGMRDIHQVSSAASPGTPPASGAQIARQLADAVKQVNAMGGDIGSFRLISNSISINASELRIATNGGKTSISITDFQAHIEQVRLEILGITQQDPLILDLDGNGIDVTSLDDGIVFDIDGNGTQDRTAWVAGNDALLALDRNNNGIIDDGTELFGDQNGAVDGFAELAKYDENRDDRIDRNDSVFSSLILLFADGSQKNLQEHGIESINLAVITPLDRELVGGLLVASADFQRDDGSIGTVGEVLFNVQA
ncbi:hypothetical protein [Thalassospira sp.]|uniref:hypothetical protein n=1 Tax=Thalassospira sp. TaxID=1912094 RepID=UPI002732D37A|nr:hypothetical protein [Thalassospira sp.]MDP2698881.1 hypothetical protein [Thalassospira sp.]